MKTRFLITTSIAFMIILLLPTNIAQGSPTVQPCEYNSGIKLSPNKQEFTRGETMIINSTVTNNDTSLEIIVKNPKGMEVFADIIKLDEYGNTQIELPLPDNAEKGTWKIFVIASPSEQQEVVFVGVDDKPKPQLSINPYILNYPYNKGENASFLIAGKPKLFVHIDVVDSEGTKKLSNDIVTLTADGRCNYLLDLEGYKTGVYTIEISTDKEKASAVFTVGIQPSTTPISIRTPQHSYYAGGAVLILGNAPPDVDVDVDVYAPSDDLFAELSASSDHNGKISTSFHLPDDAKTGTWKIKARSGPNFVVIEFNVVEMSQNKINREISDAELPAVLRAPFYQSDVVVIGEIISLDTTLLASQGKVVYNIDVQQKLKNPKSFDLISVISDYPSKDEPKPKRYTEINFFNDPVFESGDLVFAYLTADDDTGKYHLSPNSFAITKKSFHYAAPPTDIFPLGISKDKVAVGEETTISGIVKKSYLYYLALQGHDTNIYITVYDPNGNVYESSRIITLNVDGTFDYTTKIQDKNAVPGMYFFEITAKHHGWQAGFEVFVPQHMISPLKQFKSGISSNEIICKDNLVLIQKHDGSPACVKLSTAGKLYDRGWTNPLITYFSFCGEDGFDSKGNLNKSNSTHLWDENKCEWEEIRHEENEN